MFVIIYAPKPNALNFFLTNELFYIKLKKCLKAVYTYIKKIHPLQLPSTDKTFCSSRTPQTLIKKTTTYNHVCTHVCTARRVSISFRTTRRTTTKNKRTPPTTDTGRRRKRSAHETRHTQTHTAQRERKERLRFLHALT